MLLFYAFARVNFKTEEGKGKILTCTYDKLITLYMFRNRHHS